MQCGGDRGQRQLISVRVSPSRLAGQSPGRQERRWGCKMKRARGTDNEWRAGRPHRLRACLMGAGGIRQTCFPNPIAKFRRRGGGAEA